MEISQAVTFIQSQLAAGAPKEHIRALLKQNNWPDANIDAAFFAVEQGGVAPATTAPLGATHEVISQTSTHLDGENTSGMGSLAVVPDEIKGWSWGGFLLTWIWGLGNGTYLALLALIPLPFMSLIMAIILGIKGREWAWRNKKWQSVEHFKRVQKNWAIAGLSLIVLTVVLIAVPIFVIFGLATETFDNVVDNTQSSIDDGRRISDIQSIAALLEMHRISDVANIYPSTLEDLVGDANNTQNVPVDPATQMPYDYDVSENGSLYILCATLDDASRVPAQSDVLTNVEGDQYCVYSPAAGE